MSIYTQESDDQSRLVIQPQVSKYTYGDLKALKDVKKAFSSPLAVISHIDVNAFFAQVEQLKHGFSREDPVICVQWQSIIAVSYPARKYGISRMDTLKSAIKKCPHIIPLHTSVFRQGENFWRNVNSCNPDDFPSPATHKVSLDPYRRQSRKMQRIFKENCKVVEKASVDESFIDLGPEVYEKAIEFFPQLKSTLLSGNNSDTFLPSIPADLSEWFTKCKGVFVPTDEEIQSLSADKIVVKDWDDILMIIGSQIMLDIRKKVESSLGYTTSCGVARVKTLAKLASGFKKPDNQTIVRNDAIGQFLTNFDLVDFWGLGGKLGERICNILSVPSNKEQVISYVRDNFSLDELTKKLDNDLVLATKVYQIVRGELQQPFLQKQEPSMCSSKRFRGESVANRDHCVGWLKVFAGDLYQRIKEINEETYSGGHSGQDDKGLMVKMRCPRLLSLHYTVLKTRVQRSKQMPIPQVPIDQVEKVIFESGIKLLDEVIHQAEHENFELFPLGLMSLTAGKFEVISGLNFINNFFKSGQKPAEKQPADQSPEKPKSPSTPFVYQSRKKFKSQASESKTGIHQLLQMGNSTSVKSEYHLNGSQYSYGRSKTTLSEPNNQTKSSVSVLDIQVRNSLSEPDDQAKSPLAEPASIETEFFCPACKSVITNEHANPHFRNEHEDYHFAIKYSSMLNGEYLTQNILSGGDLLDAGNKDSDIRDNSPNSPQPLPVVLDLTNSPPPSSTSRPSNSRRTKLRTLKSKSKSGKRQSTLPFQIHK